MLPLLVLLILLILITCIIFIILFYLTNKHKNYEKRKLDKDYYVNNIINIFLVCTLYAVIFINVKNIYSNIETPNIITIIAYLLIVDTFIYWVHRLIHRTPFLKQALHATHHNAYDLVPLDIFYTDFTENILYSFIAGYIPLLFINVNLIEYIAVIILIFYHSLYTHSESEERFIIPYFIDSTYHKYHHQIGKGNYSVYFSFWDDYMGTRIKEQCNNIRELKSDELKSDELKSDELKSDELKIKNNHIASIKEEKNTSNNASNSNDRTN